MVSIVICYQPGTGDILSVCLASLARHTKNWPYRIIVLVRGDTDDDLADIQVEYPDIQVVIVGNIDASVTSRVHGIMLDTFIPERIETPFILTLDSDCFPIADDWLSDLFGKIEAGAKIVGILHPWAPPPFDMNKKKIEWRVRSQHCWETTHVACQMLHKNDFLDLSTKYNTGDDTGLAIIAKAKQRDWKINGFKVTRCPKPEIGKIDPEFNRYVSLVFGDKVYHHGGFTRMLACGDEPVFKSEFDWVRQKIIKEKGAEFLLDDNFSYRFKFDREEEIAKEKMQRLFGLKSQRVG